MILYLENSNRASHLTWMQYCNIDRSGHITNVECSKRRRWSIFEQLNKIGQTID